jgi:hypothetical protein
MAVLGGTEYISADSFANMDIHTVGELISDSHPVLVSRCVLSGVAVCHLYRRSWS